jgi:clan AA aspartic protease
MISGTVDSKLHARIPIEFVAPTPMSIEAIVDTGFDGQLTLPHDVVHELALPKVGESRGSLADGTKLLFPMYKGTVAWHGDRVDVLIAATDGVPLVGMALMRGSELHIEIAPDGDVRIEAL